MKSTAGPEPLSTYDSSWPCSTTLCGAMCAMVAILGWWGVGYPTVALAAQRGRARLTLSPSAPRRGRPRRARTPSCPRTRGAGAAGPARRRGRCEPARRPTGRASAPDPACCARAAAPRPTPTPVASTTTGRPPAPARRRGTTPANSSGGRPSKCRVGLEGAVDEQVDGVPAPVASGAGDAERGVVRPHRAVVVAQRVVGAPSTRPGCAGPIRSRGPASTSRSTYRRALSSSAMPDHSACPGFVVSESMGRPSASRPRTNQPRRSQKASLKRSLSASARRSRSVGVVADVDVPGQLGGSVQGGVRVALHLDEGQRRRRAACRRRG